MRLNSYKGINEIIYFVRLQMLQSFYQNTTIDL